MEIKSVNLEFPEDCNIILGQSHFIKSVEDIYEVMVNSVPGIKFGFAFCEASQDCLIRTDGTDEELKKIAVKNMENLDAGHSFIIILKDSFPINVLNNLKGCYEVVNIFCATANPVEVIIAKTEQGCGILGVIDGYSPKGVEGKKDIKKRKEFLQMIGYKR
ncbi:MAG: adenosine-specific kinase [Candidatus Cloacimonetes bacterium]|nr:adenosine-specific kinase [Candidatus Cloacimonadota bacterium]MBL7085476.1 adenosine-specific kinase [Candidatus Cloacimonadota bacterium]